MRLQTIPVSAFVFALWAITSVSAKPPHIVLVMADDQGWGDMGYNGHPIVKTPNFDASAASGLRFDRFYAAAPVCSPTRASVLTGRTPNRSAVFSWGHPIRPQEETIAEVLKGAGYTTGHFGKWHLGSVRSASPSHPGMNGFDRWVSAPNFYDNGSVLSDEGTAVKKEGESSEIAVDDALDWMRGAVDKDAPIFAVIWFGSPHHPHRAAAEDRALYTDQPENVRDFYGEITGMDRAFGKLKNALDEMGIREDTVLWYCSDNGALPKIGNTGGRRGDKGDIYEGGIAVPAILEWPAEIKEPAATNFRATTCDIFPTVLEIAGAKRNSTSPLDGVSLVPVIEGAMDVRPSGFGFWQHTTKGIGTPSDEWMEELLAAQKEGRDLPPHESSQNAAKLPDPAHPVSGDFPGHSAWVDGNWKLHRIQGKEGNVRVELYDLGDDPNEEHDLSDEKADEVEKNLLLLENWLESVARSLNGEDY